jgi:hypothetical protein
MQWMEQDNRPVIYISMGTIAGLNSKQVATLLDGVSSDQFRVLWKLPKKQQSLLPVSVSQLPS